MSLKNILIRAAVEDVFVKMVEKGKVIIVLVVVIINVVEED